MATVPHSGSLKLVNKFMYSDSSISSTESHINLCLAKTWTATDRSLIIWKSDLSDKIKCNFFQAAVVSILLYGCTTWMLMKCIEKKLDRNAQECYKLYWTNPGSKIPRNSSCMATDLTISKTIQIKWKRHKGHCWRSKDELISNILPWTPSHVHASVGQPTRT